MRDDKLYLIHIAECIERIEEYASEGKDNFFRDRKTQDAVLRNLQVLAESCRRLSQEVKDGHPEVDWKGISAFRNILVHEYLGINLVRVWEIIGKELSDLKENVVALRKSLG